VKIPIYENVIFDVLNDVSCQDCFKLSPKLILRLFDLILKIVFQQYNHIDCELTIFTTFASLVADFLQKNEVLKVILDYILEI